MKKGRLWLCVGPLLMTALDVGLTLHGQSESYWGGDYEQTTEFNPLGVWLLQRGPWTFLLVAILVQLFFFALILCLPDNLAKLLAFVLLFAHTYGAASWIYGTMRYGLLGSVALFAASSLLMDWTWRRPRLAEERS